MTQRKNHYLSSTSVTLGESDEDAVGVTIHVGMVDGQPRCIGIDFRGFEAPLDPNAIRPLRRPLNVISKMSSARRKKTKDRLDTIKDVSPSDLRRPVSEHIRGAMWGTATAPQDLLPLPTEIRKALRTASEPKKAPGRPVNVEQREHIIKLWLSGAPAWAIAKDLQLSPHTIQSHIKRLRKEGLVPPAGNRKGQGQ